MASAAFTKMIRGAWDTAVNAMQRLPFVVHPGGNLQRVHLRNGKYCTQVNTYQNVYVYNELTPQPDSENIITLRHHYNNLAVSASYQRRVS